MGLRFVFVRTPWQPIYHAVYAAFVGIVGESVIIDIDHWRHYFLILGVLWGLMAASRAYAARGAVPRDRRRRSRAGHLPDTAALAGFARRPCALRAAPGERRSCAASAERSAARLAHQSGGLGVPSSNLGAPTSTSRDRMGRTEP